MVGYYCQPLALLFEPEERQGRESKVPATLRAAKTRVQVSPE